MIFPVAHVIWYLSQFMVLHPGDLINTGHAGGRGAGPPGTPYLRAGDVVELEIDGLGRAAPASGAGMSGARTEFDGLVAVVTGGGSGIGLRHRRELAARGARSRCSTVNTDGVPDAAHRLRVPTSPTERRCEPRRRGASPTVSAASTSWSTTPASAPMGTVEDNDDDEWRRVLDVNVVGIAAGRPRPRCPTCADPPQPRSSTSPRSRPSTGLPQRALYSASQGRRARADLRDGGRPRRRGHPGELREPGHGRHALGRPAAAAADDPAAERAALEARQATGRLVTADEVAAAIAYLASPLSGSTTGTALDVDGGVTHLRVRPAPGRGHLVSCTENALRKS